MVYIYSKKCHVFNLFLQKHKNRENREKKIENIPTPSFMRSSLFAQKIPTVIIESCLFVIGLRTLKIEIVWSGLQFGKENGLVKFVVTFFVQFCFL